jgi:hypothetical protein
VAKDIVLLDISENQGGISNIRMVFWMPVTSGFPNPSFTSAYPAISMTDPSVLTGLQNGTILEEVHSIQFPTSAIVNNWATVELIILAFLTSRKAYRTGTVTALPDPGAKYQVSHDSSSGWSS